MKKQLGSAVSVAAGAVLVAFAIVLPAGDPPQAAPECLAAPKGQAPEGRHWYYRIDRETKQKCWYLGEKGQRTRAAETASAQSSPQSAPAQSAPAPTASAQSAPALAAPPPAPPAPTAPRIRSATKPIPPMVRGTPGDDASAANQVEPATTATWNALDDADTKPEGAAVQGGPAVEQRAQSTVDTPVVADNSSASATDARDETQQPPAVAAAEAAEPAGMSAVAIFFIIIGALGIAGVLLRALFKIASARAPKIHVSRRNAVRLDKAVPERAGRAFANTMPSPKLSPEDVEPPGSDAPWPIRRSSERRAA